MKTLALSMGAKQEISHYIHIYKSSLVSRVSERMFCSKL
jgi:hypothetical protein